VPIVAIESLAAKSSDRYRSDWLTRKRAELSPIERVEFTSDDAIAYAAVRSKLEKAGTPIAPLDTLIAAQAVARKLILVSNNEREFRRVAGLTVENWSRRETRS